jgi:hypothetical protein
MSFFLDTQPPSTPTDTGLALPTHLLAEATLALLVEVTASATLGSRECDHFRSSRAHLPCMRHVHADLLHVAYTRRPEVNCGPGEYWSPATLRCESQVRTSIFLPAM